MRAWHDFGVLSNFNYVRIISYCAILLRVILSGAAEPQKKQMIKSISAAKSNPEGAPAGGISALVQGRACVKSNGCHLRANAFGVQSNPEGAPEGGISALV